jgi:hypothetical protein
MCRIDCKKFDIFRRKGSRMMQLAPAGADACAVPTPVGAVLKRKSATLQPF